MTDAPKVHPSIVEALAKAVCCSRIQGCENTGNCQSFDVDTGFILAALRPLMEAVAREAVAEARFFGDYSPPLLNDKIDGVGVGGGIYHRAQRDPAAIVSAVLARPVKP